MGNMLNNRIPLYYSTICISQFTTYTSQPTTCTSQPTTYISQHTIYIKCAEIYIKCATTCTSQPPTCTSQVGSNKIHLTNKYLGSSSYCIDLNKTLFYITLILTT